MAVDYDPTHWIAGIDMTDGTNLLIPWTTLPNTDADNTDVRVLLMELAEIIKAHYDDPTDGGTYPTDETPTKFTASESTRYNDSTAEFEERNGWTFDLTVDSTSLAPEGS
jgi:hypothetical protein